MPSLATIEEALDREIIVREFAAERIAFHKHEMAELAKAKSNLSSTLVTARQFNMAKVQSLRDQLKNVDTKYICARVLYRAWSAVQQELLHG